MGAVNTQFLVYRLFVAAVAIFGPTVLFLGFWHGLQLLRDDRLVERLAGRGVVERPKPAPVDVVESVAGKDDIYTQCSECGTRNPHTATHCIRCARSLQ